MQEQLPGVINVEEGSRSEPSWMSYAIGGKDAHGLTIECLFSQSSKACVYTVASGVGWHCADDELVDPDRSIAEALVLLAELTILFPKGQILRRGQHVIASDLTGALHGRRVADERDLFASSREFIVARRRETLHIAYLVSACTTAIALGVLGLSAPVSSGFRQFLLAASFGALGSFVSVAQRLKNTPIERFSSRLYTAIAGISRSLLGGIFGMLFLLFQKAGLILSLANANEFALFAAAVAAGFSERLVPELLERFESQALSDKKMA